MIAIIQQPQTMVNKFVENPGSDLEFKLMPVTDTLYNFNLYCTEGNSEQVVEEATRVSGTSSVSLTFPSHLGWVFFVEMEQARLKNVKKI